MFIHPFYPSRFLRSVSGTEPFAEYCKERTIAFEASTGSPQKDDLGRWTAALAQLSHERHAQVELELAMVGEMADAGSLAHLAAAARTAVPPESVPRGAALALWYLLHAPDAFHQAFLHQEIEEVASWRSATAPAGLGVSNLEETAAAVAGVLSEFVNANEGTGRFCTAEAHQLEDAICFIAQIADRPQFLETFSDSGRPERQRLRPAIPVLFVYFPRDGTVLLKSHLRSRQRIVELFRLLATAVLGSPVSCDIHAFNLEPLKWPFHPLPDVADVESVRVKAIHLRYPWHAGKRQLKLETLASDEPAAIDTLLHTHVGDGALAQLRVCHAELQVKLRAGPTSKSHTIKLWPDRSSLGHTPLGDRLRACLKLWGLTHA